MSDVAAHPWGTWDRILLGAVAVLAVLAAFRLATRDPAAASAAAVIPPPPVAAADPARAAGPPLSPACTELLARIRTASERDLEGIVDRITGAEALGIYRQLSPSDRQEVLSALPGPLVARKAQELLGVPETIFRKGRPGQVAAFLADAAMGAPGVPVDPRLKELSFATAVDEQGAPTAARGSFRPEDRRIYACIDSGADAAGETGVLVRWTEAESGDLVYLHYLPLAANRRWNHVYFEAASAWGPGTYQVRFYRIGKPAGAVAEGTYVIEKGG